MQIYPHHPELGPKVFVAPNSSVIGRTQLGKNSVIEYGSILRGDVGKIIVGSNTVIGSQVVVHATKQTIKTGFDTNIGDGVYVGDGAHVHGATLEDGCVIGVGSTVLDGAVVGDHAEVAPNSLVLGGTHIKTKQLWAGKPAKYVRDLTPEEVEINLKKVQHRLDIGQVHNRYFETDEKLRPSFKEDI